MVWAGLEFICCSSLALVYKAKTNKNNWNNNYFFKNPVNNFQSFLYILTKPFFKQIQNNLKGEKLYMDYLHL